MAADEAQEGHRGEMRERVGLAGVKGEGEARRQGLDQVGHHGEVRGSRAGCGGNGGRDHCGHTQKLEVTLQKKSRAEALRQSLLRLSPDHREVIDLAYHHGKSVKEIAEIVSISEATVKTRMFYARRKLSELVETT